MKSSVSIKFAVLFVFLGLIGLVACTPATNQLAMPENITSEIAESQALAVVTPSEGGEMGAQADSSANELVSPSDSGQTGIVEVTPLSEEALAGQPPGQTEPGVSSSSESGQTESGVTDSNQGQTNPDTGQTQPVPNGWSVYSSDQFGFTVAYPSNFVIGSPSAGVLAQLMPAPNASVYFADPNIAASALAGTDAPDLEVRIFESGPVQSLDRWLASAGVVTAGDGKNVAPYVSASASGLEVCESTMVAPGCSLFIAGKDRVYQLRYTTLEGETMAASFTPAMP